MSPFKKWLLIIIVVIALIHTVGGGFADMFGGKLFTAAHGWNEGLIFMTLALVVATAMK
jgi:preprotein translocase subunit SecG